MAVSWTLEKELRGLVKARTTGEALWRLGLSSDPRHSPLLEETHGWQRGGPETYHYRFKVIDQGQEHDVLLKAVTAFSTTCTLRELVDEWVCRRHLLASGGVRTPKFYFSGRGLLVEQYVGQKLAHRLRRRPGNSMKLIDQVFALAGVMDRLGFSPVSAFNRLRTDGESVYMVDFGQDLGPPGIKRRREGGLLSEAKHWLTSVGNQVVDPTRARAVYAFHLDGEAKNEQRPT
ncbi:MAG: hypothetical protein ABI457_08980 [Hyphomicrobium sp.]